MINILSIRCSVAFATYFTESAAEFLDQSATASRVIRQGGNALIIRSQSDEVVLRHQNRSAALGVNELVHYLATVQFRAEQFDLSRMEDEVVFASVGHELLLSHPQSEIWLNRDSVVALVRAFDSRSNPSQTAFGFPDWLTVSAGGERLLLSDQRTGRWVLLGEDHIKNLEHRLDELQRIKRSPHRQEPPTIPIKGLLVHLQSAFKLVTTLDELAATGRVISFEEITPSHSLTASPATEGLELKDSSNRITLTPREAGKWAAIIRAELDRLRARQIERGDIRTVFATVEDGQWIMQWGDEIFLPFDCISRVKAAGHTGEAAEVGPVARRCDGFLMLLAHESGACVALSDSETTHLENQDGGHRPAGGRAAT